MLEEKEPDVLLLDIIMPHLDGIAVLETIGESRNIMICTLLCLLHLDKRMS